MEKKQGFFEKLRAGLKKTRDNWFDSLFGEDRITEEFYEELEEQQPDAQKLDGIPGNQGPPRLPN